MEGKHQLDFGLPLLSVRRVPSPAVVAKEAGSRRSRKPADVPKLPPLPFYKSELKSGPVGVPGSVPFVWERSPGRPMKETSSDSLPPLLPRLPPGRRPLNVKQVASDAASEGSSSPAASCSRNGGLSSDQNSPTTVKAEEKSGKVMEETKSSNLVGDSIDDEETFVDALDTLSRTESSYLNCSITGVSGLEGLDMRPTRTLSSDLQAREFMMGRFLPAAQAMASENPQYSTQYPTKKQPVLREQARQIKTIERVEEDQPPLKSSRVNVLPYHAQVDNPKEDDDDDDDYSEPNASSLGICGLLPRLCLHNSLSLLNPGPRIRKPAHISPSSVRTRSSIGNKYDQAAAYVRRIPYEAQPCKEPQSNAGWSHHEPSQPLASKTQGFLGTPNKYKDSETMGSILSVKEVISFGELLANDDIEWKSGSGSPVVEKTLYIDSIQPVKQIEDTDSTSSDKKGSASDKEFKETVSVDGSFPKAKQSKPLSKKEEEELEHFGSFGSCYLSFSDNEVQMDVRRDQELILAPAALTMPALDEDGNKNNRVWSVVSKGDSQGPLKQSTNLTRQKLAGDRGKDDSQNQNNTRPSQQKPCYGNSLNPLAPPLPKSPSESWLKRALPTVSSKTQLSKSALGILGDSKVEDSITKSYSDKTWETIVKSSGERNRRFQVPEGQLTAIPEA
ncbi:unnamed protein product [Linum trigynum]|uniref:Uncharacterized protein n=1 Tax=Linum trigynum TaxID=586398 RepID=A0AAV2F7I2_9ROSI